MPWAGPVGADQSGTPFWVSGQYASLAAVPPTRGWSMNVTGYGYDGRVTGSKSLPTGRSIAFDARQRAPSMSVQLGYASGETLLEAKPFVGVSWGLGGNQVSATIAPPSGKAISESDTIWAGTDVYPIANLTWSKGNHNWMVYVTGGIPVGGYQASRLANAGIGHASIDSGVGYTFYDAKSGAEFSAVVGVTYNRENMHTSYRNGLDSHLDWAASQSVSADWALGVAGYVYYQLTGDTGSGALLGPFKSRVAAVGPEIGYQFSVGKQQWQASLRAYCEFWAQNRYMGRAIYAVLNIPLTGN